MIGERIGWGALMLLFLQWPSVASAVDHERLVGANREPAQWMSHGRTYDEQRYSPLDAIQTENVSELSLAWSFDLGSKRGLEATPIVVDGVMYVTGTWSRVFAIDAANGRLVWEYDPHVPRAVGRAACCDVVNRGVATWKGAIFVGTLDGRLVSLDAKDGSVHWEVMTVDPSKPYTITGAPRVVKGKVLIGNGGAEYGVRGYVSAYAAESGELAWRFYTVPGDPELGFESDEMERAAKTWSGEWWKLGGGGTVWDSMAYDPELDLLYIGVGNGSPWNRRLRSPGGGDNLFLCSIVALRPDTGEYVWHYQVVPAETWDYTATQHMILADLEWQGAKRKVLMQAPKSGFFMVLDRVTGELLSAEPFAEVTWSKGYDLTTGRPIENPGSDYKDGPATVKPSSGGAHNWQPMAFHPGTGLVYIPAMEAIFTYKGVDAIEIEHGLRNRGIVDPENPPGDAHFLSVMQKRLVSGHILAWDPVRQRERWRVALPASWNGGLLATAGDLVFQGGGDRALRAFHAQTGELLWSHETQTGVIATPVTYAVDGEQFVSVLAGWGGSFGLMSGISQPPAAPTGRVLTFKIGGRAELPPIPQGSPIPDPPERMNVSDEVVEEGARLYGKYCSYCHGTGVVGGGAVSDLRRLPKAFHDSFQHIVLEGGLEGLGMPRFGDVLEAADVNAIQAFVIEKAIEDRALRETPRWWLAIKEFFYWILSWMIILFGA
jgi:quinohemoprotein ethanol dehydrogenase